MKNLNVVIVAFFGVFTQIQEQFPYKLTKVFDSSGFEVSESVVKDLANNMLYVSNIKGNSKERGDDGYISKVGLDGKIIKKKLV